MTRTSKKKPADKIPRELIVLNEISSLVQSPEGVDGIFRSVLQKIKELIPYQSASLFIMDPAKKELKEEVSEGARVDLIDGIRFEMGTGFSAWVAKEKRTILIPNLRKRRKDSDIKSFLSVPLISSNELIGVLNLGHTTPGAFTEDDLRLTNIIAGQIAATLNRAIYEEELRKKNRELRKAHRELKAAQEHIVELGKLEVIQQIVVT